MFEWFLIAVLVTLIAFVGWVVGLLFDGRVEEFFGWIALVGSGVAVVLGVALNL